MGASNFSVSEEELSSLKEEWAELYLSSQLNNPFLSWDWFDLWKKYSTYSNSETILTVRDGDLLAAIAPLYLEDGRLSFYADPLMADYADLIIRPGYVSVVGLLFDYIAKSLDWKKSRFGPVRSISDGVPFIEREFNAGSLYLRRTCLCYNPRVSTEGEFTKYYAELKKRLRQDVRTTENHLNKRGGWQYSVADNPSDALEVYSALVRFHENRQENKVGGSVFSDKNNNDFFESLIKEGPQVFDTHLSSLKFQGRIVSAAFSLRCGDALYYWIPSFDTSIRSVSLGKLHIKCLIEECFENDVRWFDFMGGEEPYKYQWANDGYELYEYTLYRSRVLAYVDRRKFELIKKLVECKNDSKVLQMVWTKFSKLKA